MAEQSIPRAGSLRARFGTFVAHVVWSEGRSPLRSVPYPEQHSDIWWIHPPRVVLACALRGTAETSTRYNRTVRLRASPAIRGVCLDHVGVLTAVADTPNAGHVSD